MVFRWRPRHDNNAIELMSLNLAFEEHLTNRALTRIISLGESLVAAAGAYHVVPVHGARVVNNTLVPTSAGATINLLPAAEIGAAHAPFVEQIEVNPAQLSYRSTVYTGWDHHRNRLHEWLTAPLAAAMEVAGVASVRLEYQDKFGYMDQFEAGAMEQLLRRDSDFIALQVFEAESLSHSHTGRFLDADRTRLEQFNVGTVEELVPPDREVRRWANIMVAREQRPGEQGPLPADAEGMLTLVDEMHTDIRALLPKVLTDEALQSIGIATK